ncbi:hypothetical protein BHM03_00059739 [Ensete ventricosum]|nr:hypothetical protein BHM03_00059739 [Ensete ventricosum]
MGGCTGVINMGASSTDPTVLFYTECCLRWFPRLRSTRLAIVGTILYRSYDVALDVGVPRSGRSQFERGHVHRGCDFGCLLVAGVTSQGLPHTYWRSYIPVFQIRMEKMKEVKRPPL